MAVSVFLGGFGFGNLGDEACLATAYKLYRSKVNCVFTYDTVITSKVADFDLYFGELPTLFRRFEKIDRVVIAGGGVGFNPSFKDNLDWAYHCKKRGAEVIVHNIGIGKIGADWAREWPYLLPVLREAREFSVRDYRSKAEVESWKLGLSPQVSFYPERELPISTKLSAFLPTGHGNKLGISMNMRSELWDVLRDNIAEISNVLSNFKDHAILPIVSTIHATDPAEHDNVGFRRFVETFGLGDKVVLAQAADVGFWRQNIGPGDVKYLISQCSCLLSARKHNIIHAVGAGVPFIGLFEFNNDSIPRVYQTLYPFLPRNSSLMPLFPM